MSKRAKKTTARTKRDAVKELEVEQRRERVAQLRLSGWSIRQIAKELRCSVGTVHSDLEHMLGRTIDAADEYIRQERQVSLARLEMATHKIWRKVLQGDLDAINCLTRIDQRRAKLLGLDAPTKQEFSGPSGGAIPIATQSSLEQKLTLLEQRLTARATEPGGTPGTGSASAS